MAPAWPIFLPGGAAAPAMKATIGFRIVLAYSAASSSIAAADLADDDDGVGAGILVERCERVARGGAEHRIAADADEGAIWPMPARVRLRQTSVPRLPLREITPTRPGLNTLGTKAGMMPTKAFARRHEAGGVGADDPGAVLRGGGVHRHHVLRRNVLGQHHQQS